MQVFEEDDKAAKAVEGGETEKRRPSMKKEKPPSISYLQLLKLNKPDWFLVLVGVLFSAVIGCLFPLISLLFSEVLRVYKLCAKIIIRYLDER